MRVLLADDDPQVCAALRLVLHYEPELTVVGEVASARALRCALAQARPDLVLLDWELPEADVSPARLLADLHAGAPELKVVVLSSRPEVARAAQRAGADAFVSKADPPEDLLAALHTVAALAEPQVVPCGRTPAQGAYAKAARGVQRL